MAELAVHPLTAERWDDLVALFGERGALAGCWCMWFRQSSRQYSERKGAGNRRALQSLVTEGEVPGLVGYLEGRPVGWCSVAPRAEFVRLQRSPTVKPIDEQPVWSIVCLYVDREHRSQGVAEALIKAATEYAAEQGAQVVEGYPLDQSVRRPTATEAYHGTVSMFAKAGFTEVIRRSPVRPIMRLQLQ